MDITQRLAKAREITDLFPQFDSRGYDAYESVAPLLLDALDASDERWLSALRTACANLVVLNDEVAPEQWLDRAEGARISAKVEALGTKYLTEASAEAAA